MKIFLNSIKIWSKSITFGLTNDNYEFNSYSKNEILVEKKIN